MAAEHPAVSASLPIPYPEPLLLASPPRPGLLTAGRGALTLDTKRECLDGGLASSWGCGLLVGVWPPGHYFLLLQPDTILLGPLYFHIHSINKYS